MIDSSIPLQGKATVQLLNPMEVAQQGMTMRRLSQQNNEYDQEVASKNAMRDAYKNNVVTDPATGKTRLNQDGVLAQLYKTSPVMAAQKQQEFNTQNLAELKAQSDMKKQLVMGFDPRDPNGYMSFRAKSLELGLPNADKLPEQYPGESYINQIQMSTLDHAEQLNQKWKEVEQQNKGRELDQKDTGLNIQKQEANQKGSHYKDLHEEHLGSMKDRQSIAVQKMAADFKKDLDPDAGRTGNFGQISSRVQSAERLETLANAFKDGNLPPAQVEEFALGLSNMLAPGGGGSRAQVEALVPHSAVGDAAQLKNWLFNEPGGANQQKFVKMMSETIAREKETSNNQLNSIREQRLPLYADLAKKDPEKFKALMQSYKLDPNNYDQNLLRRKDIPARQNPGQSAAPPPPKHGTVDSGYVFMGGDPADQKSWKKQ